MYLCFNQGCIWRTWSSDFSLSFCCRQKCCNQTFKRGKIRTSTSSVYTLGLNYHLLEILNIPGNHCTRTGWIHFLYTYFLVKMGQVSLALFCSSHNQYYLKFKLRKTSFNKGRVKRKVWKIPQYGGWVCQEWDKIHKKNMPLKSILDHFKSF